MISRFLQRKNKRNRVAGEWVNTFLPRDGGRKAYAEFWATIAQKPISGGWRRKRRKIHVEDTMHKSTKNTIFWAKHGKFGFLAPFDG